MTEATVNDQFSFKLEARGNQISLNGEIVQADILHEENSPRWQVMLNGKTYLALVTKIDREENEVYLVINGKKAKVKLSSEMDLLLARLGMAGAGAKKAAFIKAPMPGMIYSLRVNEGDSVKKGDAVLILEAMKMENVIKAPGDGVIGKIHVKPGMSVEKGQLLVTFG